MGMCPAIDEVEVAKQITDGISIKPRCREAFLKTCALCTLCSLQTLEANDLFRVFPLVKSPQELFDKKLEA